MNTFCTHCGNKLDENQKFCTKCGLQVGTGLVKELDTIKCGNCGYIGPGKRARRLISQIAAWLCVFFAPLITIIYFAATHRYKCPKCNSSFVGVKNKSGTFINRKNSVALTLVFVLIGIAITGILTSVILASLNTAREKGLEASRAATHSDWVVYNSVSERFNVLLPTYPILDSESNLYTDDGNLTYQWKSFTSETVDAIFYVYKYIYSDEIDLSDKDALLESYLSFVLNIDPGNVLVSSNYSYHGNHRSLNFSIKNGQQYLDGKIIVVGQTPYFLLMEYFPFTNSSTDYYKFTNSFRPL